MRTKSKYLSFISMTAVVVTAYPAAAASKQNFEGPYVGAYAGYSQTGADVDNAAVSVSGLSASGAAGGVYGGVASHIGAADFIVIGVEADYGFAGGEAALVTASDSLELDPGRTVGASGRIGLVPADRLQLFGKVGYAHTRFTGIEGLGKAGTDGLRYGGGAEYALNRNWALRAEISHVDYAAIDTSASRFDPSQTRVTAGLGLYF